MKGQQRVLNEVMIFAIGITITSFIVISFQTISDNISKISVQDQLTSVSNLISSGVIKAAGTNSIIRLRIPKDVSGMVYKVYLAGDMVTVYTMEEPVFVDKEIFKIDHPYIIKGEVFSSAEYINIRSDISSIVVERSGFE